MELNDYFGKTVADHYDASSSDMFSPEVLDPCVDLLKELAGTGAALEFGIGTGRIAIPLSARGVHVQGIDLSSAMVDQLRRKERGREIPVALGDFATTRIDQHFSLVYLAFNTIMNLCTQESQVACFRNAASHLLPGGYFLIEVMIPDLQRLPFGECLRPLYTSQEGWGYDEYDVVSQGLVSHHITLKGKEVLRSSIPFRYVWPSELDLMAELAGMALVQRWGGWKKQAFDNKSLSHVSVWQLP